jgi:4-hydroxybenzoate polyprenyltransferase
MNAPSTTIQELPIEIVSPPQRTRAARYAFIADASAFEPAAKKDNVFWAHLEAMRPRQWTKNAFCLAGVLFTDRYLDWGADFAALLTALVFCAASSSLYVFNDLTDRERDRIHPRKRRRPIARGAVSPRGAFVLGSILGLVAVTAAAFLHPAVAICVLLQMANNTLYSARLKHLPIFDVVSIAMGFVLRLLAGVYVVGEIPTTWIVLCTFFLALFLGFCKRRAELSRSGLTAADVQRPVLGEYTVGYLDYLLNATSVMALTCYALSTTTGENPTLVFTVPIVFFAIMHYKRLVMLHNSGEEPEEMLLGDLPLQLSAAVWLVSYLGIMHADLQLVR